MSPRVNGGRGFSCWAQGQCWSNIQLAKIDFSRRNTTAEVRQIAPAYSGLIRGAVLVSWSCYNKPPHIEWLKTMLVLSQSSVGQKSQLGSTGTSAEGLLRLKAGYWQAVFLLGGSGKNLLPCSFRSWAECTSLWLQDWGPHVLIGCQLEELLSFQKLPASLDLWPFFCPQSQQWCWVMLMCWVLLKSQISLTSSVFTGSCGHTGSTWTIQLISLF